MEEKKQESSFEIEELLKQNKRLRLMLKIIILLLFIAIIFLFYYKKNLVNFTFKLNGEETVILNYGEKYEEEGFSAKIYDKNISNDVTVKSDINLDKLGEYEVKYRLKNKYLNIDKTLIRKVKVVDVIPPELTINSEEDIYIFQNEDYVGPSYTAIDNYDKDITDKVVIDTDLNVSEIGTYTSKYTVKDSSENESTKEIKIHVEQKKKNSKVVISISNQRLDYYEKGEIVFSTPVVTGINNGTPKGNYTLLNKARNVTLVGENYESFVKYWMPFIGRSYGLHDASWRSNFGGEIYKSNGSHGCVNLPTDAAAKLYDMIEVGTTIIISD